MSFAEAVAFVLEREGGFVHDPVDRGGATKYGITQATLRRTRGTAVTVADVRALRISEAVRIYERDYWQASGAAAIGDDRVALCVFDAAVNHGPVRAVKLLQSALGVTADGIIGPASRAALDAADPAQVCARYLKARAAFFRQIVAGDATQQKFLAGWLARCRHVARECGIPIDASYAAAPG